MFSGDAIDPLGGCDGGDDVLTIELARWGAIVLGKIGWASPLSPKLVARFERFESVLGGGLQSEKTEKKIYYE